MFWVGASNFMQALLMVTAWLVGLTGTLLNVAIFITTNLGPFIKDTPVIYNVWTIIRDLASMVLIFVILWAAIQMILNLKQPNFGNLLKNIVIMGILINFSFFFAQVMIDASNIVSLQFFNAITPGKEYSTGSKLGDWTSKAFNDGGLSNVFMGALQVNGWYKNMGVVGGSSSSGTTDQNAAPIRIVLVTFAGMIVMIFASMSFLAAAAVCLLRTAMLIFLLAFSPIWIAAFAFPELKEVANPWWKQFKVQLLFLPTYLILMYVAIRVLNESGLNKLTGSTESALTIASQANLSAYTSLFVGFTIVLIMINLPLIGALSIAGAAGTATEKWFKGTQSWLGRNTMGRFASRVNESDVARNWYAKNPRAGMVLQKQLSKVSSASFASDKNSILGMKDTKTGFDKVRKDKVSAIDKYAKGLGFDDERVKTKIADELKTTDSIIATDKKILSDNRNKLSTTTDPDERRRIEATITESEKELEKRVNERDTKAKELKKSYESERKGEVVKFYQDRRSTAGKFARLVTGNKRFKGPNKWNASVFGALKKDKDTAAKLIDALKDEVKPKDEDKPPKKEESAHAE